MFQSYECIGFVGYNEATKQFRCEYKLVDTDFEDVGIAAEVLFEGMVPGSRSIIDCYTKRNLPVAKNLIRYMLSVQEDYSYWTLDRQVEWQKQNNPRWHEVEDDMKMYLVFS
jgi:hypothetical protein